MKRTLFRTVAGLLVVAALSYPIDWAIWKTRMVHGDGMGKVQVAHVVAAAMKDNKDEYYLDSVEVVDCSQSLYPQAGKGACWWVQRHRQIIEQY